MNMHPEVIEKLLDAGRHALPFAFFLSLTNPVLRTFCTTVLWHDEGGC